MYFQETDMVEGFYHVIFVFNHMESHFCFLFKSMWLLQVEKMHKKASKCLVIKHNFGCLKHLNKESN